MPESPSSPYLVLTCTSNTYIVVLNWNVIRGVVLSSSVDGLLDDVGGEGVVTADADGVSGQRTSLFLATTW